MGSLFSMLFAKISAVVQWVADLFIEVFVSLWEVVSDVFAWLFDQCFSVAVAAVNSLDTSAFNGINGWGALPAEITNILSLLGVGTAVTIITAAIGIRLVLQLIPFTRLGS